ncbi:MAG: hypothetical protein ABR527_03470 [Gemmatimonadota bacterium]
MRAIDFLFGGVDRPAIRGLEGGSIGGDGESQLLDDRSLILFRDRRGVGEENVVSLDLGAEHTGAGEGDQKAEKHTSQLSAHF